MDKMLRRYNKTVNGNKTKVMIKKETTKYKNNREYYKTVNNFKNLEAINNNTI